MELLSVIGARWWIVVLCVRLGGAGGALALKEITPTYQSDSQLLLTPVLGRGGTSVVTNDYVVARGESYAGIVTSSGSRLSLLRELQRTPGSAYPEVSVSMIANTTLLSVTVIDTTGANAQRAVDAVDTMIISEASMLDGSSSRGAKLETSEVSSPIRPSAPSSPDNKTVVAVGVLIGLVLGLAFAYAAARFSRPTVRGRRGERQLTSREPIRPRAVHGRIAAAKTSPPN